MTKPSLQQKSIARRSVLVPRQKTMAQNPSIRCALLAALLAAGACGAPKAGTNAPEEKSLKPLVPASALNKRARGSSQSNLASPNAPITILATGLDEPARVAETARAAGLKVEGSAVLSITGQPSALQTVRIAGTENPVVVRDEVLIAQAETHTKMADEKVYYLAKQDFGLPDFWAAHPTMDGRGATAGVIDDGVSLFHTGLQETTTGQRKIRTFRSASPELNIQLTDEDTLVVRGAQDTAAMTLFRKVWSGTLDEPASISTTENTVPPEEAFVDWNENGKRDSMKVAVARNLDDSLMVCIDLNTDEEAQQEECFGEYATTGEFRFWKEGGLRNLAAVFDEKTATLSFVEGEASGDGHAEGVASVLAGHKIGGLFDGVAPGAQIVDYDLSSRSGDAATSAYTIGTFLRALDWMGTQNVDVANISYSLYFQSVDGQFFMQKALQQITQKHNMVISFSAGNNGPGLGSLNRRAIYPPDTLVAGAYVGQKLYEYIHGVRGLPPEGRVVSYSSRGPGPLAAFGPSLISPLASLSHGAAGDGYRAFSGTSSASPALAGLATVLISALRQTNLPVYADHVVNALRLSGQPLTDVPFVEQGYGLPKIERALAIYQRLLKGKLPLRLEGHLKNAPAADGARAGGIFLKLSELQSPRGREFTARMKALLTRELSPEEATNTLYPVTLKYSAPWVSGPERSFLSAGSSDNTFNINPTAVLEAFRSAETTELFASIDVIHSDTADLLWTIPITLVHDQLLTTTQHFSATLGTEEAHRHHFSVPKGTRAVRVEAEQLRGSANGLTLHVYDPTGIKIHSAYYQSAVNVILPTPSAGWHQVALTKYKGGTQESVVQARVTPVALDLASSVLDLDEGTLHFTSNAPDGIDGQIDLRVPDLPIATALQKLGKSHLNASVSAVLTGNESRLAISVSSLVPTVFSYFDSYGHSCLLGLSDDKGDLVARVRVRNKAFLELRPWAAQSASDGTADEDFRHSLRKADLSCTVFENTSEESAPSLLRLTLSARDRSTAEKAATLENWSRLGGQLPLSVQAGQTAFQLPELLREAIGSTGVTRLEVRLRSYAQEEGEGVSIGVVDVL